MNNPVREEKKCPRCGYTFKRFRDTFLLGCEVCYSVFAEELMRVLNECQGCDRHYRVESDESVDKQFSRDDETELMWVRYDEYVKAGNYEDAEQVYNIIQRMRGEELCSGASDESFSGEAPDGELALLKESFDSFVRAGNYEDADAVARMMDKIREGKSV